MTDPKVPLPPPEPPEEKEEPSLKDSIFFPDDVGKRTARIIDDIATGKRPGLKFGTPVIDKFVQPARPGEVIGYLGYTGNYKTNSMNITAEYHALKLRAENDKRFQNKEEPTNRIVVSVLWEQAIEEFGAMDISRMQHLDTQKMMRGELTEGDLDKLWEGSRQRSAIPWVLVGHSVLDERPRPRLSMSDVKGVMLLLKELGWDPILLVLDYLQRMKREHRDTREGFMKAVDDTRDIAIQHYLPVLLGCQAGRKVMSRPKNRRLPQTDDAQETSNFEQSCSKLFGWWLPKNDMTPGSTFKYAKVVYTVHWDLCMLVIRKNTWGKAPLIMPLKVDYEQNRLYEIANFDYNTIIPKVEEGYFIVESDEKDKKKPKQEKRTLTEREIEAEFGGDD